MIGPTARRLYLAIVLSLSGVAVAFAPTPAAAQKMSEDGFEIPWFHSRASKMARQACIDDLPECRDSVRKQIATERVITQMAPWVGLCLFFLIASLVMRFRESQRRKRQEEIARNHARTTRQQARDKADTRRSPTDDGADDDAVDDGFGGMGAPRGRR